MLKNGTDTKANTYYEKRIVESSCFRFYTLGMVMNCTLSAWLITGYWNSMDWSSKGSIFVGVTALTYVLVRALIDHRKIHDLLGTTKPDAISAEFLKTGYTWTCMMLNTFPGLWFVFLLSLLEYYKTR